jgi:predicted dehydrogenase
MDRLRNGVIGLGWFGEFHCDAILGVPNLELAALCTRTPERRKAPAPSLSRVEPKPYGQMIAGVWRAPRP